jgi:hypothetical protein
VTLHVVADSLGHYLDMVGGVVEGNPLLKCGGDGRMTLVSPGRTHEQADRRLGILVVAVCSVLEIPFSADGSTLYPIPGTGHGYIPDESYYIQHHDEVADATTTSAIPPDLVIEIVVSHPAADALADCALLGVPEVWVWDVPRERLEFHLLVTRGENRAVTSPVPGAGPCRCSTPATSSRGSATLPPTPAGSTGTAGHGRSRSSSRGGGLGKVAADGGETQPASTRRVTVRAPGELTRQRRGSGGGESRR